MEEKVVLVDTEDAILGEMEKLAAHQNGLLHRAFSVFIFDDAGKMLLQQRAANKYHSPKLWTNACCSHPRINETYLDAAKRRINEELGIVCELEFKFNFIYKAKVGKDLWEHELDHVFVGKYNGEFALNPDEVLSVKYMNKNELNTLINEKPEDFTAWFHIIWKEYQNQLLKK